jgi:hypothetical protein
MPKRPSGARLLISAVVLGAGVGCSSEVPGLRVMGLEPFVPGPDKTCTSGQRADKAVVQCCLTKKGDAAVCTDSEALLTSGEARCCPSS